MAITGQNTVNYNWDHESRITSITKTGATTNSFEYNGLDTRTKKIDSIGTTTYRRDGAYVTDPVLADSIAGGATTKYTPGVSEYRGFGNVVTSSGTWQGFFGYAGGFGYQEDPDYGLKLLGHRYYDSSTGRFLSRDPVGAGRNWSVYAASNPLNGVDPSGLRDLTSSDVGRLHKLRKRMKDEGMNDKFINQVTKTLKDEIHGVPPGTEDVPRLKALWWAIDNLGNANYGSGGLGNDWNCNIFVYDAYLKGADVAMPDRKGYLFGTQPFGANAFGDPKQSFDEFWIVSDPLPGDIIAFGARRGSGHMSMKVASGLLIYAGSKDVKVGKFGENQANHNKFVARRHRRNR